MSLNFETFYRFLKLNSKYKMKIPDHRLTTNKWFLTPKIGKSNNEEITLDKHTLREEKTRILYMFPDCQKAEMLVQHKSRIFNQSVYLYQ